MSRILHLVNSADYHLADIISLSRILNRIHCLVVSGVSAVGDAGFLESSFIICELMKRLAIPSKRVLVVPSKRDQAQLNSYTTHFHEPVTGFPYQPTQPGMVSLPDLHLLGINAHVRGWGRYR